MASANSCHFMQADHRLAWPSPPVPPQVAASQVGATVQHARQNDSACAPRLPALSSPAVPSTLVRFPTPTTLVLADGTPVTSLTAAYQHAMATLNRPLPNLAHRPPGFLERDLAGLAALHLTDGSCAPLLAALGVLGAQGGSWLTCAARAATACLLTRQLACAANRLPAPRTAQWLMPSPPALPPLPSHPLQTGGP